MTLNEVKNSIKEAASEYGFETRESTFSRLPNIRSEEMNFSITERSEVDWDARKATIHIAAASVRKMGGDPTVEELLKTAEEIKRGAELVARLRSLGLAFTEEF